MSEDFLGLGKFSGTARLFPLPNVVLFPFVTLPLHIFEPRYRQMTADALTSDQLIAMVLLRPGWEEDYEGRPALWSMACLGRIVAHERLEDGRCNIQLRGLTRARILQEVDTGKLYRGARLEIQGDQAMPDAALEQDLRSRLIDRVPDWCQAQESALDLLRKLLRSNMPLGAVCDIVSFALPLSVEFKQELLQTTDVETRVSALLHFLCTNEPPRLGTSQEHKFPPDFSSN